MYKCKGCGKETTHAPNYNKCEICGCDVAYVDTEVRRVSKRSSFSGPTADESDSNSDSPYPNAVEKSDDDGVEEVIADFPQGPNSETKCKDSGPHQSTLCEALTSTKDGWLMMEITEEILDKLIEEDVPEGSQHQLYLKISPLCIREFLNWKKYSPNISVHMLCQVCGKNKLDYYCSANTCEVCCKLGLCPWEAKCVNDNNIQRRQKNDGTLPNE